MKSWKNEFTNNVVNWGDPESQNDRKIQILKILKIRKIWKPKRTVNTSFSLATSIVSVDEKLIHLKFCFKKRKDNFSKHVKTWKKIIKIRFSFSPLIIFCWIFLSEESSTSSPGGNQVDGLPTVSSLRMFLQFFLS